MYYYYYYSITVNDIPLKCENKAGEWNCELSEARCGDRNIGGEACEVPCSLCVRYAL